MIAAGAVRRGRPPNAARRRELAWRALSAFADAGYEGCAMSFVAERCGLARTLLARYFPSKQAILAAIVEEVCSRFDTTAEAFALAAGRLNDVPAFLQTAGNVFVHHVDQLFGWYATRLGKLPLTTAERERLRAAEQRMYAAMTHCLRALGETADAETFAFVFLGSLRTYILSQARDASDPAALDARTAFLDRLVRLMSGRTIAAAAARRA